MAASQTPAQAPGRSVGAREANDGPLSRLLRALGCGRARTERDYALFAVCLSAIVLHFTYAALFGHAWDAPARTLLAVAGVAAVGLALAVYGIAGPAGRAGIAAVVALPAIAVGAGIHAVHAFSLGLQPADVTGLLLLAAGVALMLLAAVKLFRLLRPWPLRLLMLPGGYLLVIYLIVPLAFGVAAANVARLPNERTPALYGLPYEAVSFPEAGGIDLAGWYIPSGNGAAVVTLHGASGNRARTLEHAVLLARHGYGVLMLDIEGFGESEGRSNNFGWYGARDVAAAFDYLRSRPDVAADRIGVLGLSMGAEIALTAAADLPGVRAVVAEGAGVRTWRDYRDLPEVDWPASPAFLLALTVTRVLSGAPEPPPLSEVAPKLEQSVLLISADVSQERQMNRLLDGRGGANIELWEIPEAAHTQALERHPQEYEERVVAFLGASLLR